MATEARSAAGYGLLLFAAMVTCFGVFLFGLTDLAHARTQRDLKRDLRAALSSATAPPGGAIPEGSPIGSLHIPRLNLRQAIVEGTDSGALEKGPGHLRSSPLPGQPGNAVVAGRRTTYGAPFRRLDRMRRGDKLTVTTAQGRATYVVERVTRVRPGAPDVLEGTGDDRLTLVTSDPAYRADRRLAVVASLANEPFPVTGARPNQRRADEDGLRGEAVAVAPLLTWLLLLLVGAVLTTLLRQRWARWPACILTAPVLAALVFLVFDSFDRLLPATL